MDEHDRIDRSNHTDGTDADHNTARVESLVAAIIGINVSHRRDPTGPAAGMIDGLRDLVRHWRKSDRQRVPD